MAVQADGVKAGVTIRLTETHYPFLRRYMLVTGIGCALLIAAPQLALLGFMLLIVPGIILAAMPTAFLWGCAFSIFYLPARCFTSVPLATACSLTLAAALLWTVVQPSIRSAQALRSAHQLPIVATTEKIKPTGNIRIEKVVYDDPRYGVNCDETCLALLSEPGVRSVVMNNYVPTSFAEIVRGVVPLSSRATAYRLHPMIDCSNKHRPEERVERQIELRRRFTGNGGNEDLCVSAGPAYEDYDLLLREGRLEKGRDWRDNLWSISHQRMIVDYDEIHSRSGRLLYRSAETSVDRPTPVMTILPFDGSGLEMFFGWGRIWDGKPRMICSTCFLERLGNVLELGRSVNGRSSLAVPSGRRSP